MRKQLQVVEGSGMKDLSFQWIEAFILSIDIERDSLCEKTGVV
jgi:hypothetical protein